MTDGRASRCMPWGRRVFCGCFGGRKAPPKVVVVGGKGVKEGLCVRRRVMVLGMESVLKGPNGYIAKIKTF